eukprot:CFRG2187T1
MKQLLLQFIEIIKRKCELSSERGSTVNKLSNKSIIVALKEIGGLQFGDSLFDSLYVLYFPSEGIVQNPMMAKKYLSIVIVTVIDVTYYSQKEEWLLSF